jgi:hypothetical protein
MTPIATPFSTMTLAAIDLVLIVRFFGTLLYKVPEAPVVLVLPSVDEIEVAHPMTFPEL